MTKQKSEDGCGLYSRQQARNISRSSGTMSFSETLSLAPMKSTPPRCRGIVAVVVGVLAVTVPWTIRRMLAESSVKTLYSGMEPGTWAGRNRMVQLRDSVPTVHRHAGQPRGSKRESPDAFAPTAQGLVSTEAHILSLV